MRTYKLLPEFSAEMRGAISYHSRQLRFRYPCRLADRQFRSAISASFHLPSDGHFPAVHWIILLGPSRGPSQTGVDGYRE